MTFNRRRWLFAGASHLPIIVSCGPHVWGAVREPDMTPAQHIAATAQRLKEGG